jgi:hypothetical protein
MYFHRYFSAYKKNSTVEVWKIQARELWLSESFFKENQQKSYIQPSSIAKIKDKILPF